jgi:hypothetical protein
VRDLPVVPRVFDELMAMLRQHAAFAAIDLIFAPEGLVTIVDCQNFHDKSLGTV